MSALYLISVFITFLSPHLLIIIKEHHITFNHKYIKYREYIFLTMTNYYNFYINKQKFKQHMKSFKE